MTHWGLSRQKQKKKFSGYNDDGFTVASGL